MKFWRVPVASNEQTTAGHGATSSLINVTGAHLEGTASLAGLVTLNVDVALAAPVTQTALVQPAPQCASSGQFISNPSDASAFYVCAGTPPQPIERICPTGLLFNAKTSACDWPDVVQQAEM
ncbi:MAG: carbohydrate-binding module family 14 protein [Paraburkholderia sp.]|uniref:carbohydrate-binding module family 14 protein n=1 Tax=Paraburkholderia sp. TaxID=1926495 RepID=UPI0010F7A313